MKILTEKPPMFDAIAARFPNADVAHAIFSWGDRIYNLSGHELSRALLAHEMVHCARQGEFKPGDGYPTQWSNVEAWWHTYLDNDEFRLSEELLAHAAEFRVASMRENRNHRRTMLVIIARRLSGPLYGHMISLAEAKRRITELAYG